MFRKLFHKKISETPDTFTKKKVETLFNEGIKWMNVIIFALVFSGWLKLGDQAVIALCTIAGLVIAEIITVAWKYMTKAESETDKEAKIKLERDKLGLNAGIEKAVGIVDQVGEAITNITN